MFNKAVKMTLSPHRGSLNHLINLLLSSTSPFSSLYNLSEYKLGVLKDYINKNLKSGFIIRSKSSAEAFILFIKKKDDSLRLCVNYKELN